MAVSVDLDKLCGGGGRGRWTGTELALAAERS
jgi:hypothetical protein